MDSNEEFEFKPLTEGLGFHSKKIDLAHEVKKSKLISETLSSKVVKEVPTIPFMAREENQSTPDKIIKPTLPRIRQSNPEKEPKKDVIDELIESFKKPANSFVSSKKELNEDKILTDKILAEKKAVKLRVAWALAPFLVDMMIVTAFFLIGLIIALYITKVDIIDFVVNSVGNIENILVLPAIMVMMIFMYSILTRIFMNGTLGELIFDMQLGSSQDQKSGFYGFKVLARVFLIVSTGFVTLPLISWIFRDDFSGKIIKLQLIKKK
jgi:hypothetical protein